MKLIAFILAALLAYSVTAMSQTAKFGDGKTLPVTAAPPAKPAEAETKLTDAQRIEFLTLQNQKHTHLEHLADIRIKAMQGMITDLQTQLQAQGDFEGAQSQLTAIQKQLDEKTAALNLKSGETIDLDTATVTPAKPAAASKSPGK